MPTTPHIRRRLRRPSQVGQFREQSPTAHDAGSPSGALERIGALRRACQHGPRPSPNHSRLPGRVRARRRCRSRAPARPGDREAAVETSCAALSGGVCQRNWIERRFGDVVRRRRAPDGPPAASAWYSEPSRATSAPPARSATSPSATPRARARRRQGDPADHRRRRIAARRSRCRGRHCPRRPGCRSTSQARAIPSMASASSQAISGFGLPKLRQSVTASGRPPAQATLRAAPKACAPRRLVGRGAAARPGRPATTRAPQGGAEPDPAASSPGRRTVREPTRWSRSKTERRLWSSGAKREQLVAADSRGLVFEWGDRTRVAVAIA